MNQFSRITKASFCVLMLSVMKASCYIGTSGKSNASSVLQSDATIEQTANLNSFADVNSFNDLAERFSDHFVSNVVSALQTDSASFLESKAESQFNFKEVAKEQAKGLLKEVLKTSLEPIEQTVAESVSPPTLSADASKFAKFALKELFNKAEKFAGVNIPDSIWESNGEEEDESEEGEDDEDSLDGLDYEYEDEEGADED